MKIGKVRKDNPYHGKVKIRELLLRENIKVSLSCVGNALKKLLEANIIVPVCYLTCQKERKIIRKFNGYSKRLSYGYKAHNNF
jgi:hypothetical protein